MKVFHEKICFFRVAGLNAGYYPMTWTGMPRLEEAPATNLVQSQIAACSMINLILFSMSEYACRRYEGIEEYDSFTPSAQLKDIKERRTRDRRLQ
jgi:hypothetical protein